MKLKLFYFALALDDQSSLGVDSDKVTRIWEAVMEAVCQRQFAYVIEPNFKIFVLPNKPILLTLRQPFDEESIEYLKSLSSFHLVPVWFDFTGRTLAR